MNRHYKMHAPTIGRRTWRARGFTLIELMIVVAIVAILAALAYPSYTRYIVRTHRVAAEGCLSEYANYMERYYTTNLRYDENPTTAPATPNSLPSLGCASAQQTGGNYLYQFATDSPTATTYVIEAIPQGAQGTRDTACGTLSLDQAGKRTISGNGDLKQCW